MAYLQVLLGFARAADHVLEETADHVLGGLYLNKTIYPSPPAAITDTVFDNSLKAFREAMARQESSGKQGTAAKDQAREALISLMRQLAGYVQSVIQDPTKNYGLAELLLSGFDAVSTNRPQHALGVPAIKEIVNSGTAQLTLRVKAVRNARMYEVQKKREGGTGPAADWESAGVFASTRGMVVTGLEPGVLYAFRVRAMGGSTGQSEWSDAVSHRSL